jgi:endo-1,4-beta-xylanase
MGLAAAAGAHLVWDEGFGDGWTEDDLFGLDEPSARRLLFGTVEAEVRHYRGRVAAWSVANEVTSPEGVRGLRTDVPWYATIGPSYVAEAFHLVHQLDPKALLVLNEFGFEAANEFGDRPEPRRRATLQVIDRLLHDGVPRRPLAFDQDLQAKPAYFAISDSLTNAPRAPRCGRSAGKRCASGWGAPSEPHSPWAVSARGLVTPADRP